VSHPGVHLSYDGPIARIELDRPGRKNACTRGMWLAISESAREIAVSGSRLLVISGANDEFCAGADLVGDPAAEEVLHQHGLVSMRAIGESVMSIHQLPIPVIAAVDGVAVGAGFGLALAADLLYCTERSRFSLIFAKRGLSLDYGTSYLLPLRVGLHHAKQLAFTGEIIGASEADRLGFVNKVVPDGTLADRVAEIAETIVSGPPLALSMTKRLLDNASNSTLSQSTEAESLAQNVNFSTDDTRDAMAAFADKRTPEFRGQ